MPDFDVIVIIGAGTLVAAILLTIAFDIPKTIIAALVMAVFAVCVELYIRSNGKT
jgi:uncharacterized membrane protein YcaP (DUF421 family)